MARPSRTGGKTRAAKTRKAGSVKGRSITVLVLTATINLISAMKAQALLAGRRPPPSAARKHGHSLSCPLGLALVPQKRSAAEKIAHL